MVSAAVYIDIKESNLLGPFSIDVGNYTKTLAVARKGAGARNCLIFALNIITF